MLTVIANKLELRGVVNKTSKNGTVYYVLNMEDAEGTPMQFYCPESNALPQTLRKGDKVNVTFEVKSYKGTDKLIVRKVEKVA